MQTRNKMRKRYPISVFIATIMISTCVRHVMVTKEFHPWHHHGSHVTWMQFTIQIENDLQTLQDMLGWQKNYSWSRDLDTIYRPDRKWGPDLASQVLHVLFWLSPLSDMLGWHKNYIYDIIMVVTWLGYNSQKK